MGSLLGSAKEQEPGLRAACCSWLLAVTPTPWTPSLTLLDSLPQPLGGYGG